MGWKMKRIAVALLLCGCIRLGRGPVTRLAALAPPPPELCDKLRNRSLWLSLSSIGVSGLGGAASTMSGANDQTVWKWGFIGAGAGLSIVGGLTGYLAAYEASQFTRRGCQ
jgi:hypothetical protein